MDRWYITILASLFCLVGSFEFHLVTSAKDKVSHEVANLYMYVMGTSAKDKVSHEVANLYMYVIGTHVKSRGYDINAYP